MRAAPAGWAGAGFAVAGDRTRIGTVPVRFGDRSGWSLSGSSSDDFDGIETELADPPAEEPPAEHPNGALGIDHVVAFTSSLERTIAAFEGSGVRCRRIREAGTAEHPLRQAFFRLGEVIAEVVQVPAEQAGPGGAARLWGVTITVADLQAAAADLGELCGTIRDAVQPGRRIATIRKEAGLGLPVALISPEASAS